MSVYPYIICLACVHGYLATSADLSQPRSEKMYNVAKIRVTKERASHICQLHGMELVSIPDKKTNDIIVNLISHHRKTARFWTSGIKQTGDRWVWWDHQPLTYTNWGSDEPNNMLKNENCLYMYRNGEWCDVKCEKELYFICESVNTNFNQCERQSSTIILNIDNQGSVTNAPNISCCCNEEEYTGEEGHDFIDVDYDYDYS